MIASPIMVSKKNTLNLIQTFKGDSIKWLTDKTNYEWRRRDHFECH